MGVEERLDLACRNAVRGDAALATSALASGTPAAKGAVPFDAIVFDDVAAAAVSGEVRDAADDGVAADTFAGRSEPGADVSCSRISSIGTSATVASTAASASQRLRLCRGRRMAARGSSAPDKRDQPSVGGASIGSAAKAVFQSLGGIAFGWAVSGMGPLP